ncbi:MAG: 2-hydroxyacid dehydrogenase [Flavobacterium sp.]
MKILHLDSNHEFLKNILEQNGFINIYNYSDSKEIIEKTINEYEGIVIRSRFPIDKNFIDKAKNLKFIARVGAGLENIDVDYAQSKNIKLFNAAAGNSNAVGEHTLGMLISLMNHFKRANQEVVNNIWKREENRGFELENRTVAIIGYGNMGKSFAKKLKGFDCEVLFFDILNNLEDANAKQATMEEIFENADVLSLHIPLTKETENLVNQEYINNFKKNIWFLNTARGKCVVTKDVVLALQSGKIIGAGLDVLEYEKSSFENIEVENEDFNYLKNADNVILTPHIAGWTHESKLKLVQVIANQILELYQICT